MCNTVVAQVCNKLLRVSYSAATANWTTDKTAANIKSRLAVMTSTEMGSQRAD